MDKKLKAILRNKKLSFGSWITLGHTSIPEIMARAGFDWLAIDMEHSVIDIRKAQELIQASEAKGLTPLVRVTENDPSLIKRVMDAGASGVIVPMVNTEEEALKAVKAVKYPPLGTRGVGLARAQGYGQAFEEYKSWVNTSSLIIIQIEHIDAVNNLEGIFALEEIDAYLIGPYDLSASLGIPGELQHRKVINAEDKVLEISRKYGKAAGIHIIDPDIGLILKKIEKGYTFIAVSIDFLFLGNACIKTMNELRLKMKEKRGNK